MIRVNKYRFTLATVIGLLSVSVGLVLFRHHEPVYQGKTLRSWLIQQSSQSTVNPRYISNILARNEAEHAIRELGSNAVPDLIQLMQVRDSPLKRNIFRLCPVTLRTRCGLFTAQEDNDLAYEGFYILGPEAESGVPALIDLLNSNQLCAQREAATILGLIGYKAKDAVPALIKHFDDPDQNLHLCIISTLGAIHAHPDDVVPLLTRELERSNQQYDVSIPVLLAIKNFGPQAVTALPTLRKLLNDGDPAVREYAAGALKQIDSGQTNVSRLRGNPTYFDP